MREALICAGCFVAVVLATVAVGTFVSWGTDWLRVWEWSSPLRLFWAFETIAATVMTRMALKMWNLVP